MINFVQCKNSNSISVNLYLASKNVLCKIENSFRSLCQGIMRWWDSSKEGGWSSSSPPIRHSCTVILVLVLVLCIWVNYVGRIKRKTIWKSGIINRSHPASCILHPAPRSSALLQCIKWQVPESVRKIGKWKKKSEPSHESNRGRGELAVNGERERRVWEYFPFETH